MKRFFGRALALLSAFCLLACLVPAAEALDADDSVVVAFGDSITASGSWFSKAEKEFGVKVINKGVGGENSSDGRKRLQQILDLKPDVVTLSFGMNDAALDMAKYVPLETYAANMEYMADALRKAGAKVILLIVNPIGEEPYYTRHDRSVFEPYGGANAFFFRYVTAARELAEKLDLTLVDMYQPLYETGRWNDFLADGVHPNASGYALYAEAFRKALYRVDLGDVNGDGEINAADYFQTKGGILGTFDLGKRKPYADANCDDDVNALDYLLIKSHVLGNYRISRR